MNKKSVPAPSLKEACVQAAREVIAEHGVESLSMRDVARKLAISHQAPYRHFESRDHLLAEIMRRCFADFARHLDGRPRTGQPEADLEAMGHAYLAYAREKPLEYRLMFGTPWPEPAQHPELVQHAVHAFDLLRESLRALHRDQPDAPAHVDRQALFIWSTLHGMASITQADVMQHLQLAPGVEPALAGDVMARIGLGLGLPCEVRAA
ncbi:TetR/AcrR family transcriptional regulator [Sphaerotilus sp.]|uniref:TetR/AcrR family transcriptional regulator n=1 Tax=Sphaerotilus sp. TaxID=2093942 RepID=UPI002ACDA5E5|nr:TetR/AcrR family transcriptional regulator [Sphaerotilus sp.]MDZ7855625.1 TetR/AcrR family transcriptional regulator [Sphaerotilus sp.]